MAMRQKSVRSQPKHKHRFDLELLEERALLTTYNFVRIEYDTSSGCCGKSADLSINNDGMVAFTVSQIFQTPRKVLQGDGGPLRLVAESNETTLQSPVINQKGFTTFTTGTNAQGQAKAVYSHVGWPNHPLLSQDNLFSSFGQLVDSNDDDLIAFRATLANGGEGIYSLHENSLVPFLNSKVRNVASQPVIGNPSVNNAGQLAFTAFNGVHYGPAGDLQVLAGDLQLPRIQTYDNSVVEGSNGWREVVMSIDLSGVNNWDSSEPITVHYTTIDGSAVAGEDYQAVSGMAVFAINPDGSRQSRVSVPITVHGDSVVEGGEYFLFQVSNVSDNGGMPHAIISNGTALVQIWDDDSRPGGPELCNGRPKTIPRLSMTRRLDVSEGDSGDREISLTLHLTRSSCFPDDPVTVAITAHDDTAHRGEDYELAESSVTFPVGVTVSQAITIVVHGDTEPERASFGEKFFVDFDATNALSESDVTAIQILNDDGTFQVLPQRVAVNDSGSVAFVGFLLGELESGLYVATGEQITPIANSTGPFDHFLNNRDLQTIALNNLGQVAFYARLDDGRSGIFSGPDPSEDKVVAEGDLIQDLKVWKVIQTVDLNDEGQIAFAVQHDEHGETVGIYRAEKQTSSKAKLSVQEVQFMSGYDVSEDTGKQGKFLGPHWKDTNGNGEADPKDQHPYAYKSGDTLELEHVLFRVSPVGTSGSIWICGDVGDDGTSELDIPCQLATIVNGQVRLDSTQNPIKASNPFPKDKADALTPLTIAWSVSWDGGKTFDSAGKSVSPLYVTLYEPLANTLFHTPLHLGSTSARGATNADEVIEKVWQEFADQDVRRFDGTRLTYYQSWRPLRRGVFVGKPDCTHIDCLLDTADSQCGGWAELFRSVLRAQGLTSNGSLEMEYVTLTARLDDTLPSGSEKGFIVHNWEFGRKGANAKGKVAKELSAYPFVNIPSINSQHNAELLAKRKGKYEYAWRYKEVQEIEGISGQGTENPASLFDNHQVIRITSNGTTKIYDPSYGGTPFSSVADFEAKSIAGYWVKLEVPSVPKKVSKQKLSDHWVYFFQKNPDGLDLVDASERF